MKPEPAGRSHGGTDYIKLALFLGAVRCRTPIPIDVDGAVAVSATMPRPEKSIAKGGWPVQFPGFTPGKWKTRKPSFGVVA